MIGFGYALAGKHCAVDLPDGTALTPFLALAAVLADLSTYATHPIVRWRTDGLTAPQNAYSTRVTTDPAVRFIGAE